MTKRYRTLLFTIIIFGIALSFYTGQTVTAITYKCLNKKGKIMSDIKKNDALNDACTSAKNDGTYFDYGALWFSGDESKTSISQTVTVRDWEPEDGKVSVYLHGTIINAKADGSSAKASHIKIVRGSKNITGSADKYSEYAPLENEPSSMTRPQIGLRDQIISARKTFKLNVPRMLKDSEQRDKNGKLKYNDYKTLSNGNRQYNITLQVFRCYGDDEPGSDSCGSSTSKLNVEIDLHRTLTAYAVTVDGTDLNNGKAIDSTDVTTTIDNKGILQGASATVTAPPTISGHIFLGWRRAKASGDYLSKGNVSYTESIKNDTIIYAVYESFSATSTLDIKSKNDNVSNYGSYTNEAIYAKPSDTISYEITYGPAAQGGINLKPQTVQIEEVGQCTKITNNTSSTLDTLFNACRNTLGTWTNKLVTEGVYAHTYTYTNGDTSKKTEHPQYKVTSDKVGKSLTEKVSLQYNKNGTTPEKVEITTENGKTIGNIYTQLSKNVTAHIPYNFINSTSIVVPENESNIVYVGETKEVNIAINVNKRRNNSLEGTYATSVPNAKWKIGVRYGNNTGYAWTDENTGTLNSSSNPEGSQDSKRVRVNIPDASAGSQFCVVSAVYPKDSYSDLNLKTDAYSSNEANSWSTSAETCYKIAKKPSIQILGGNLFSKAKITGTLSVKNNLAGITAYDIKTGSGPYVFGSWGELGLVSAGTISGFASGASLGYASDGSLGGSNTNSLCKLNPLTFANCGNRTNGTVGSIGASTATTGIENDKNAIINKFIQPSKATTISGGEVDLLDDSPDYYYSTNQLTITSALISKNQTKVVQSKAPIIISGNLIYNTESYTNLYEVPKLVIYAENNNIIINCNVTRIDAVLVANNVKTCNSDDINSAPNSTQLTINGAIIANSLTANRTYGAAQGVNSIVPAEIIDFDSTLYLWGGSKDDTETTEPDNTINGDLETTYLHESPPRY